MPFRVSVALEAIDIFKALLPDVFGDQRLRQFLAVENLGMDPHHQHLFIIRAVKNADLASPGALRGSPEIAMVQFFLGWRFERPDLDALRIHPGHDVLDGSIFAGGIHGLKNQQQAPAVLRRQNVLQIAQFLNAIGEAVPWLGGFEFRFKSVRVGGIVVFELEMLSIVRRGSA
jgi:hypothetical protein